MAKKPALVGDEVETANRIERALTAWHEDRKEWADRAMRLVLLVNSGAAVALAAFIGSTVADPKEWPVPSPIPFLFGSFACFLTAIVLVVGYNVYRFLWAEYRIWYLRWRREELWDDDKLLDFTRVKTQHPPTRPQLWLTYLFNGFGALLFAVGLVLGFLALIKIV